MLVNTGIKLTEDEINNALYIINYASAADRAMKFAMMKLRNWKVKKMLLKLKVN